MQGIIPHLWYDTQAVEAATRYCEVFPDSRVADVVTLPGTPSGDVDSVTFELFDQPFMAISAGPDFAFTPAISFAVSCATAEEVDRYTDALSAVPEAEQCGWVKDRFGVSWQLSPDELQRMLADGTEDQVARLAESFLAMKRLDLATLRAAYEARSTITR